MLSPPPLPRAAGHGRPREHGAGPACSAHTAGLCAGEDQGRQTAAHTGRSPHCCWPCTELFTHRTSQGLTGCRGRGWGQGRASRASQPLGPALCHPELRPGGAAHSLSPSAGLSADRPHPLSVQSRSGRDNTLPSQSPPEDAGQKHFPAWNKGSARRRGPSRWESQDQHTTSGVPHCHWGAPREMRLAGPGRAADAKTGKLPGTEGDPGVPGKLAAARIPILVPAPRAPPLSPDHLEPELCGCPFR